MRAVVATQHPTSHETDHLTMHDRLHMPRSRGAASGLLIVLLGLWGGLIPFVGPSFDYSFTPDLSWHWTTGRLLLEVLPAIVTVVGGLVMTASASRVSGSLGAWLAAAGGAWFVVGQWVSMLWNDGIMQAGQPTARTDGGQVAEWLGFFLGLGVVIVFLAAMALGRMSVVSVRDTRIVRRRRDRAEDQLDDRADDRADYGAEDAHTGTPTTTTTSETPPTTGRRVRQDSDTR
jgi:hypothetical protein